jgi:uncharacterized protein DUF6457
VADPADEHLSARRWLDAFAGRLGVEPPTRDEFAALLDLAGVAAHSSQRVAAPVACWLAARADVGPADALTIARDVPTHG